MSSRQRQLLAKEHLEEIPSENANASNHLSEDDASLEERSKNPYAILGLDPDSDSEPEDELQEDVPIPSPETSPEPELIPKSKKKKKKKKSQKNNSTAKPSASSSNTDREERNADSSGSSSNLLSVQWKSLTGELELNRMFGASVVASVEADLERKRRQEVGRSGQPMGRFGGRYFVRKFILTHPRPEWSSINLEMKMISKAKNSDGELFEYTRSEEYNSAHERFLQYQDSGDPNMLGLFLQQNPFHVEALLAMHDLLLSTGSTLHAEECLDRALFALEAAWSRQFGPNSGTCRLDYKVEPNRFFFKALFTHIQRLSRKGCLKTAFECCKFLLSLDSTDPLGALCMIDYLALRAGQFEFVEKLIEFVPASSMRPGFAFSLALSQFKRNERRAALILYNPNECTHSVEASMESLVQAVLMYPLAIQRLSNKLKKNGTRLNPSYETVLKNPFFARANDGDSQSLSHLINLFVERNHLLYKAQEVLDWLLLGCQKALQVVNKTETLQGLTVEDWTCVRETTFPSDDYNRYSHLHLYDFSDEIHRLPEDVLQRPRGDALGDIERRIEQEIERNGVPGLLYLSEEELRNANPLVVFLQSLLPWIQPEQQNRGNH